MPFFKPCPSISANQTKRKKKEREVVLFHEDAAAQLYNALPFYSRSHNSHMENVSSACFKSGTIQ